MFPARIELATFCVLDKCDNHYTMGMLQGERQGPTLVPLRDQENSQEAGASAVASGRQTSHVTKYVGKALALNIRTWQNETQEQLHL